jgi:hypothetical protein
LKPEAWAHVVEGNELLYGFQVDTKQTRLLEAATLPTGGAAPKPDDATGKKDGEKAGEKARISALGGADVTTTSPLDSVVPIHICTRPGNVPSLSKDRN